MATYTTPGVQVEEISNLAPSVAQVATAVPAFIGYTASGSGVARIDTLLDYENTFGSANPVAFQVDANLNVTRAGNDTNTFLLYYAVKMYFLNGGGSCYIISVGNYTTTTGSTNSPTTPRADDYNAGLSLLAKLDEPTLIVLADAVNLDPADYYAVSQSALALCARLADRFVILDVQSSADPRANSAQDITNFRDLIGITSLDYGAAYYPYVRTTLAYQYQESQVSVTNGTLLSSGANGITVSQSSGQVAAGVIVTTGDHTVSAILFDTTATPGTLTITLPPPPPAPATATVTAAQVVAAWAGWTGRRNGFSMAANGDGSAALGAGASFSSSGWTRPLSSIATSNNAYYSQVKAALAGQSVVLPPSALLAGVYVSVDGSRGVWKAPANVSLNCVIGPVLQITNDDQSDLNVDAIGGKSINAIRAFTGKGTLVWGARTLAGNDNDWRYIPVRRLFITIEESCQKAANFAVFESNDAITWLKVKSMIESYLYGLWQRGALAGTDAASAYYVNVGLGSTMTPQDVLEGRMIVEVGAAAVRPAEFIVLRFTQMIQQS